MALTNDISKVVSDRLDLGSPTTIETRIGYQHFHVDHKSESTLNFFIRSDAVEKDMKKAEEDFLRAMSEIEPLKPYIKTETETCHMKRLSGELAEFIQREAELNQKAGGESFSTIPHNYPKWFEELPKRSDWNIKHALNVEKKETGVIDIAINIAKDSDPAVIIKNIEDRKDVILETLANRVSKYTPGADTEEKKAALKEEVKKLNMVVSANENQHGKRINIQFMSELQMEASKTPNGFDPQKMAEYVASNPLTALPNGEDDKDPDPAKPKPLLQKALARSVLFAGETAIDIFPLIAGKEDMARAVGKSLTKLKNKANDPYLSTKIDAFLADAVFKDQSQWGKPVEKREDIPSSFQFAKDVGTADKPYQPGLMLVTLQLPADKAAKIYEDLAALAGAQPDAPAQDSAWVTRMNQLALARQALDATKQQLGIN